MKTLVVGGAGMLGHKLVQVLHARGVPVECTVRGRRDDPVLQPVEAFRSIPVHEGVDAMDLHALRHTVERIAPDFLINCVGIIKQRDEAKSALPSITINSLLPHALADWASAWGGRVIHFSTDCVFDGKKGDYRLDDPSDAVDLYGKSKYLGEVKADNAVTLRTSIIGRELSHYASLVEWFLSQRGKTVKGFTRAIYSGMTTETMADLVYTILTAHPELTGLHHAVSEKISKYELLLLMREAYDLDVRVEPENGFFCDRSMLDSGLGERLGFEVPSWREQICRMASDPTPYRERVNDGN